MRKFNTVQILVALAPTCSVLSSAYAQEAPSKPNIPPPELEEVVVTGTLIRGNDPVGTHVIGVGKDDVAVTGATTTAQLLQTVPQLGSFLDLQFPTGFGNTVTVNRPNLRSLPGAASSGGSTTLVLMDGHRIVGAGVNTTTPDPDIIPPGAIERLEIVPDGGSAVYGSDAVAGVMNFVTRKKFNGLQIDGHYGFADNYNQADANITGGHDWGSGGFYVSYNYAEHDALFGRDRDFVRQFPLANGLTSVNCSPGSVLVGNTYYGLPYAPGAGVPNTPNQCDESDNQAFYPKEHRHSVFGRYVQDLSDAIKVDLQGFYTNRKTELNGGPYLPHNGETVSDNVDTAPFFVPHQIGTETSQTVYFNFGNNNAQAQRISLETWGITPTLTADLNNNWQLRLLGGYGESTTTNHAASFNDTVLNNAINAGLFNPYDPASSNPAALAAIANDETFGLSHQKLQNVRAVVDGDLLSLPGGGLKLAAGVEYSNENWRSQSSDNIIPGTENTGYAGLTLNSAVAGTPTVIVPPTTPVRVVDLSRNVKSAFSELVVPIVGSGNAMTGLQALSLSAAGRYDKYSDVGSTTNPKIGLNYEPVEWFKVRGAWGKSFNAPSLADAPAADITTLFEIPSFFGQLPSGSNLQPNGGRYPVPAPGSFLYVIRGNSDHMLPQRAKTTSIGFDMQPPVVPGLNIGVTYFKIDLQGVITVPDASQIQALYQQNPQLVTLNPTAAQLQALVAKSSSFPFGHSCESAACLATVYGIVDIRKQNLGDLLLDGLDMNAKYTHDVGPATLNFAVNANYELRRDSKPSPTSGTIDLLAANNIRFKMRTQAGAQIGHLLSEVTWNHQQGFDLDPAVGFVPQSRVASFDVINLFLRYDFSGEGPLLKDLSLSLNVDNVFDRDPPAYRGTKLSGISGVVFGSGTLGRVVQLGVSKKFF